MVCLVLLFRAPDVGALGFKGGGFATLWVQHSGPQTFSVCHKEAIARASKG